MIELLFALVLAFSCPAHNPYQPGTGTVITNGNEGGDSGGEGEHVPPGRPIPPPSNP